MNWGVYGVPETFVIDKKGVVRYKQTGPVTPEVLEKTLLPLVQKLQQEGAGS
jgi:cytochrome c biogenesis protein CcmG/thiol:disulfide interchange protein DsbE